MSGLHSSATWIADLLWRASWQGGLAVCAVWLVCWLIPHIPARFQAWCWRLVLLKVAVVLVWMVPPLAIPVLEVPSHPTAAPVAGSSVAVAESFSPARDQHERAERWAAWHWLLLAWGVGASWQLFRLLQQGRQAAKIRVAARPITEPQLRAQYHALCQAWGVRQPPALLIGTGSGSPFLVGLLRPAIVLPQLTLQRLTAQERELVLGHELAHYLRNDLPWGVFAAVVRAVFFFHPAVWLAEHHLRAAQEAAADASTIEFQHGNAALYAERLVAIVSKLGATSPSQAFQIAMSETSASLHQRLFVMRFLKPVSRPQAFAFTLVLVAAAVLGIVPWTLVAAESAGEKPPAVVKPQAAKLLLPSLGQKREEVVKLLGEPTETETFQGGIESLRFKVEGVRCYVEIAPKSKQAIQIFYFKPTPFTAEEIDGLLARNAEGATWQQNDADQGSYHYRRSDQGFARGGPRENEYLFAVLSGSAVAK